MRRRLPLVLALAAAVLVTAPAATSAPTASAPQNLRAFLLRIDEPLSHSFPRTPSFAWAHVRGAIRYEFQLSTSSTFRENGIVYSDTSLTAPVAAPNLTLPWITGEPHALYARVRAVLEDDTTDWSKSFGFDMEPAKVAAPLPSAPGLLRWTPVDGAIAYDVWFVDIPKIIRTTTNVADQREFYSFHQAASWLGTVRWRVRALRLDFNTRANGLPASMTGPWSPVYSSVNPPFATGPLKPVSTVSDVVTTGAASGSAHRLMPAFVFGGNEASTGGARELYRVHVYTDRKCVNRVFTSAIVGSPAYAPRYTGPLLLPRSSGAIAVARGAYLSDGNEGTSFLADAEAVTPNESLPKVEATTSLPAGKAPAPAAPGGTKASEGAKSSEGSKESGDDKPAPASEKEKEPSKGGNVQLLTAKGAFGPPVDLWDTDWSNGGGYYWTVVPVDTLVPGAATTSVGGATAVGATTLPVVGTTGFAAGDTVSIGAAGNLETATITQTTATALTLGGPLKFAHGTGEPVVRTNGTIEYRDAELAQDACAGGRVLRFGKESEPALTNAGEAFASGLTPDGVVASAEDEPEFYGSPLVAWTPALGSSVYAVQWSKRRQPFKPETDPATGALGMLTLNTSAVLPLEPGTWYYRVRGYSFALPTGSQALSWSDPQKIVVAKPEFTVVDEATAEGRELRVPSGGFAVRLPKEWSNPWRAAQKRSETVELMPLGVGTVKLAALGKGHVGLFVQATADGTSLSGSRWERATVAVLKAARGRTGPVSCTGVSLPAGASVRCTMFARVRGGVEGAVVYALQHRGATYTLTFASTPAALKARRATFSSIARTFRFTS